MQQSKPLTCGEGAAVITNDDYLNNRMILLKTDGRSIDRNVSIVDYMINGVQMYLLQKQTNAV